MFLLSTAQCKSACLWRGWQSRSPGPQPSVQLGLRLPGREGSIGHAGEVDRAAHRFGILHLRRERHVEALSARLRRKGEGERATLDRADEIVRADRVRDVLAFE